MSMSIFSYHPCLGFKVFMVFKTLSLLVFGPVVYSTYFYKLYKIFPMNGTERHLLPQGKPSHSTFPLKRLPNQFTISETIFSPNILLNFLNFLSILFTSIINFYFYKKHHTTRIILSILRSFSRFSLGFVWQIVTPIKLFFKTQY